MMRVGLCLLHLCFSSLFASSFAFHGLAKPNIHSRLSVPLSMQLLDRLAQRYTQADDLRSQAKAQLLDLTKVVQPNGLAATPQQRAEIAAAVTRLQKYNPTTAPARSNLMAGFWRLLYTDFDPPAPSSGKLGPFTGDVFQDLDPTTSEARNLISIKFPPIRGALTVSTRIADSNTWEITFDRSVSAFAGIPIGTKVFEPGKEVRLWQITYLDDNLRIVRARRRETPPSDAFLFILAKADTERFTVGNSS